MNENFIRNLLAFLRALRAEYRAHGIDAPEPEAPPAPLTIWGRPEHVVDGIEQDA